MKIFISSLLFSLLLSTTYGQNGSIRLVVNNIKQIEGSLCISLYNKAEGFLKEGFEYKKMKLAVNSNEMFYIIDNLPQGEYALALYHDKNEDRECNRNWLGIPTEGYGFSCNFKPVFAPPSFKKVKVKVVGEVPLKIKILNSK